MPINALLLNTRLSRLFSLYIPPLRLSACPAPHQVYTYQLPVHPRALSPILGADNDCHASARPPCW